jgi:putative tricarboxylic transport membrane protein
VKDLLGGHVKAMFLPVHTALPLVQDKQIRILGVGSEKRWPLAPDVPTLAEQGFKLPDIPQTRGIVGPPGMPAEAVTYYEGLFDKLRQSAGWKKFLADNQLENVNEKSAQTRTFLTSYEEQLRGILKEAGAKVVR